MTTNKQSPANILLIDDHPAVRQGLSLLLKSSGHVVAGEAWSRAEAKTLIDSGDYQLAILDLSLEDGNGLDLLTDLTEQGIPALVYSMHEDPETISRAIHCGARGYVTKREEPDILLDGVEAVLQGELFISARSNQSLTEQDEQATTDPLDLLSDREREIFVAIGRGFSNTEIADRMNISPRTVETYLSRIVYKLELENILALRKIAISENRVQ